MTELSLTHPTCGADGGKRRKVLRTTYNDKGEEVTELVWEEETFQPDKDKGIAEQDPSTKVASPPKQPTAAPSTGFAIQPTVDSATAKWLM